MKVLVTGELKELRMVDLKSGCDCANDIIGNMGDLNYDENLQEYVMDTETFEWWKELLAIMEENEELSTELSEDKLIELQKEASGRDFDDEIKYLNQLLRSLKS
ncbi:MAG: hypothetical protein K0Q53_113 [Massilibacillus sp.]|jgi:hypothetical protein|nr:hypothetical protein [Massilibacillus sp.]